MLPEGYLICQYLLDDDLMADFSDLYRDAINDPVIDFLVVKLRYRFGT